MNEQHRDLMESVGLLPDQSIIMMVGSPGSGKSAVARQLSQILHIPFVASDAIRKELTGDEANATIEPTIWSTVNQRVDEHISNAHSVIVDATHCDHPVRLETIQRYRMFGAACIAGVFVDVSIETALARNRARERTIPDSEVHRMFGQIQTNPPMIEDGFDIVYQLNND